MQVRYFWENNRSVALNHEQFSYALSINMTEEPLKVETKKECNRNQKIKAQTKFTNHINFFPSFSYSFG